jgi:teichuronic acid exporter
LSQEQGIKQGIIASLFWKLMERGGTQGAQFVITIVLARILLPSDFGLIALITVFISVSSVFIQSGFNTALIQKKDVTEVDFSSVFYLSLSVSILIYVILFFSSPFIAHIYRNTQLISILRVLTIMLPLGVFNSIQNAIIARNMVFKKLFFSSLGAMLISGAIGIGMAYQSLGVWSLVAYQLSNQLAIMIILWFTVKWRPCWVFSYDRVKALFSYGWKLLASGLLNTIYGEIRTLIIGRIYNSSMLGFYDKGKQIPQMMVMNVDGSIQSVMLPALAAQQENRKMVKDMMRRSIITSSFIMFPIAAGLAAIAAPAVEILLTEKWLPAVPFLQIFCAVYVLQPIQTANLQAINALGRSDIFLRLEIIKKVIGIIILAVSIRFGIYAIAGGLVLSAAIASFINTYPNRKLLNYSYIEQWRDIGPSLLISLAMGGIVYLFTLLNMAPWETLLLQILGGIVIYIGLAKVFRIESLSYLVGTLREIVVNRRGVKATE